MSDIHEGTLSTTSHTNRRFRKSGPGLSGESDGLAGRGFRNEGQGARPAIRRCSRSKRAITLASTFQNTHGIGVKQPNPGAVDP